VGKATACPPSLPPHESGGQLRFGPTLRSLLSDSPGRALSENANEFLSDEIAFACRTIQRMGRVEAGQGRLSARLRKKQRKDEVMLRERCYGPVGPPHIGTFRPTVAGAPPMVAAKDFSVLTDDKDQGPGWLAFFPTTWHGLRKVRTMCETGELLGSNILSASRGPGCPIRSARMKVSAGAPNTGPSCGGFLDTRFRRPIRQLDDYDTSGKFDAALMRMLGGARQR